MATSGDIALPSTRGFVLAGESYAYHEEYFARGAQRYLIPTRRSPQNCARIKAADYIRSRWKLEQMRRTIDDAFVECDVVVLPKRRRTPRTIDAAIKLEESDKIRRPELENTGSLMRMEFPQFRSLADSLRRACRWG